MGTCALASARLASRAEVPRLAASDLRSACSGQFSDAESFDFRQRETLERARLEADRQKCPRRAFSDRVDYPDAMPSMVVELDGGTSQEQRPDLLPCVARESLIAKFLQQKCIVFILRQGRIEVNPLVAGTESLWIRATGAVGTDRVAVECATCEG